MTVEGYATLGVLKSTTRAEDRYIIMVWAGISATANTDQVLMIR